MPVPTKNYISIGFDAAREPLDEFVWIQAEIDGDWINVTASDRLRSRREAIERIAELDSAIIGVDFPLSFPIGFIQFLQAKKLIKTQADLLKIIRNDLKKNTDDGVRLWIEYIGEYRESQTEQLDRKVASFSHLGAAPKFSKRPEPPAHERRTLVERFRRVDRILRRQHPDAVASTLGVQYNRLTRRYEFVSANARGRSTIVGLSFIEQIKEAKPETAIWPFDRPKSVTITEVFPKLLEQKFKDEAALRQYFDHEEDNALFIPRDIRDQAYSNEKVRETLFSLIGMLSAERRINKSLRPLRDYRDAFYSAEEPQLEGWAYGVGFRDLSADEPKQKKSGKAIEAEKANAEATDPTEAKVVTETIPSEIESNS